MSYFAYVHCKPDGTPFYVGKGTLRRAKYLGERNAYHKNITAKYGKTNILIGTMECSNEKTAFELEKGIIKCFKNMGISLTNFTDGGEGGTNPCEETRKRLSEAAKKRGVSKACQEAKVLAKKGKPLSVEQRLKQSEAMKGIKFTDEHRKNISDSAKKRGISAEVRAVQKEKVSKKVIGKHPNLGVMYWDSATIAAQYLQGNKTTVTRKIKNGLEFNGWKLGYIK